MTSNAEIEIIQRIEKNAREIETIFDADGLEIRKCSY